MKLIYSTLVIITVSFSLAYLASAGDPYAVATDRTAKMPAVDPSELDSAGADPLPPGDITDVLISASVAKPGAELRLSNWINSEPATLAGLKGRVVMLDFWTFGCYNCVNTLPAVNDLHSKYQNQGLTIIGIETPETKAERVLSSLQSAVTKRGIKYAVATDYKYKTWDAYKVNAWPTVIILDKAGLIRYIHVGEGEYDTQDKVVRTLLAE